MVKVAVCDDSEEMLNAVSTYIKDELSKHEVDNQIYAFKDGNVLLEKHEQLSFDVLFLDINMPEIDGFEVAKKLREMNTDTIIIFVTSQDELVYDSFEYQPFNFIKKEDLSRLKSSISRVLSNVLRHIRQNEKIELDLGRGEKVSVRTKDILYIKSSSHYLDYYLVSGEFYHIRGTISQCEKVLQEYDIIKVHKTYMANLKHVQKVDTKNLELLLTKNVKIIFSRSLKDDVMEKFRLYSRSKL